MVHKKAKDFDFLMKTVTVKNCDREDTQHITAFVKRTLDSRITINVNDEDRLNFEAVEAFMRVAYHIGTAVKAPVLFRDMGISQGANILMLVTHATKENTYLRAETNGETMTYFKVKDKPGIEWD